MSVYTRLSIHELSPLVTRLALGKILRLQGIADGVVNTNYRLETTTGSHVLTIIENTDDAQALPFVAGLLVHLAKKGIPCPHPVTDDRGRAYFVLKDRPALLASFLPGLSPTGPSDHHLRTIGKMAATLHLAGEDYPFHRENPMGHEAWQTLLCRLHTPMQRQEPEMLTLLSRELAWLGEHYLPLALPTGLCHADLFPDNTLFSGHALTGVIDFFFACHDRYVYDLAVTLNAWCFDDQANPVPGHAEHLLQGYESIRPLTASEREALSAACRAAALRFSLSRYHALYFPRTGETVTRKPPAAFVRRLRYFQTRSKL